MITSCKRGMLVKEIGMFGLAPTLVMSSKIGFVHGDSAATDFNLSLQL